MNYTESLYLDKISPYLINFSEKGNNLWACSCNYCGDSKSNKRKTRGYFHIGDEGNLIYSCRNCSVALPLGAFIKDNFPNIYLQYKLDVFSKKDVKLVIKPKPTESEIKLKSLRKKIIEQPKNYQSIVSLDDSHTAKLYLTGRAIPDLSEFGYTDNFKNYVAEVTNNDERYKSLAEDKRIIIPLILPTGQMVGFQGRDLKDKSSLRYITIKMPQYEDEYVKIFGLNNYDKNKAGFIVEGPFDSKFLPNAIGMCGTSLDSNVIKRGLVIPKNNIIIIDNEPRNKQIVQRMEQYVDAGFRIYIPPTTINTSDKDINKMILAGWTKQQLVELFVKNSYTGIKAKIQIKKWAKC